MNDKIKEFQQIIDTHDKIVFFGGAGVSTESGIPDFRSVDGLYNQQYDYPPETILSHTFYRKNTKEFYRFYHNKMLFPDAQPNAAHLALAKLEQMGKLTAVVTRTSMVSTRQPVAKMYLSFMALFCVITVKPATHSTICLI